MYINRIDKFIDEAISEAMASLLSENAPISGAVMAVRLMEMACNEIRPERAEALRIALNEVNIALFAARAMQSPEQQFLSEDTPPPGTCQH